MKKAIIFLVSLISVGILLFHIRARKIKYGLAGRYPSLALLGQIKKGHI